MHLIGWRWSSIWAVNRGPVRDKGLELDSKVPVLSAAVSMPTDTCTST